MIVRARNLVNDDGAELLFEGYVVLRVKATDFIEDLIHVYILFEFIKFYEIALIDGWSSFPDDLKLDVFRDFCGQSGYS